MSARKPAAHLPVLAGLPGTVNGPVVPDEEVTP